MRTTITLCVVCVLVTLFSCTNWLPGGGDNQLHFLVHVQGLKDTLTSNKDTLTISAVVSQPATVLDINKGYGVEETTQIPLSMVFEMPVEIYRFGKNQSGNYIQIDATDEFEFKEVMGSFSKTTIPKFDITANQCVLVGKLIPKVAKSGIYTVEFGSKRCSEKGVVFISKPKINLTDTQKNYSLLNDTLKQTAGVGGTSRGNIPFTFAFYVK